MSRKQTILVTGVSGFVGSHVVLELLKQGYNVKGTVRSGSLEHFQTNICPKYPGLTLVQLDDIATGDITDALKDVDAIIHVASPLAGRAPPQSVLETAVEGTLNIFRQAVSAGVTKIVLTSSWATALDPSLKQIHEGGVSTSADWGKTSREEVISGKYAPIPNYFAVKILAEQAAWKFAQEHPELDLATINPPFIYGPLAPGFPLPSTPNRLSTNRLFYVLLSGGEGGAISPERSPFYCDVRDVARAHVAALKVGRAPNGKIKRYLISGGAFSWKEAAEYIAEHFPEQKHRLPPIETAPPRPGPLCTIDTAPAKEELGMTEYIGWEKMLHESVELVLEAEKTWGPK